MSQSRLPFLASLFLFPALFPACFGATESDGGTEPAVVEAEVKRQWPPLALVYRGDDAAGCRGCSEAVQQLLETSSFGFVVKFVGPHEALHVDDETLERATLYAQPAGNASLDEAWEHVKATAPAIRKFVKRGGRYLGFCMGGYFAGSEPGFELLPGDTDQWIASKKASVRTEADALVRVDWGKKTRFMYFQDGPYFIVDKDEKEAKDVDVLARYSSNEKIAALVAPYGKGKVGVAGPHPEADASWYALAHLSDPDGPDADLGHDLLAATMK
ncbi:MAG TPA: BPL-N domain-containing protein [Labilithrix sp.]|nr:BPL-N domain-containing protein [Labilithrix sp.]